tara:strand:- start:3269 stop:3997 length:729 start_codon:yes stop_codon:yes gene_type:complete
MKKKNQKKNVFNYEDIPIGFYDKIYKKKRGIQSKWHHIHYKLVKKILGNYKSHLDVGCAGGTFVNFLEKNKKSYGADISHNQIKYAKQNYQTKKHKFFLIKNNIIPFKDNTFDVITNLQLIEHLSIKDNKKMLIEIKRILKKNGRLIITTPNYSSPWVFIEKIVNLLGEVKYNNQHITFFNKKNIKVFLNELGFKNIVVSANMFLSPFFALFGWKIPDAIQKFEDKFFNHRFRLFLFVICKK